MTDDMSITKAVNYAAQAHLGQVDKRGRPYIVHCLEVGALFFKYSTNLIVLAIIHDTAEDNPEFTIERATQEFGVEIGEALNAITRREGEQYFDYIRRCNTNPLAREVKLVDLTMNIRTCPDESLKERYVKALGILHELGGNDWTTESK